MKRRTRTVDGRVIRWVRPRLYPKQEAAIFAPERYAIIEATPKSGKTVGCMAWLTEQAVQGRPGDQFWWIAPVLAQAEMVLRRTRKGLPRRGVIVNETRRTLTLPNHVTIWFKSADVPDTLYGEDVRAAVIDEAPRCKETAWHAIRTTLTATNGPLRIIGNVKGRRNWAYFLARQAEAGEPDMHYAKLTALDAIEAGLFDEAELEDARRRLPDHVFRELYFAEASDDQGNPFGLDALRAAVHPLSDRDPVVWGWDLAKSVDWTVGIGLDAEGRVCRFERFQRPWEETIRKIVTATGETQALVDSTGVGDPVLERLQTLSAGRFEGFKFSPSSKQQVMEGLAIAIQERRTRFPEGSILAELQAFEYVYTATGVRYLAVENMHDDCVCALALAVRHHATYGNRLPQGLLFVDPPEESRRESYVVRRVLSTGSWFPND